MTRGRRWTRIVTTIVALAVAAGCGGAPARTSADRSRKPTPSASITEESDSDKYADMYAGATRALEGQQWIQSERQVVLSSRSPVAAGAEIEEHLRMSPDGFAADIRLTRDTLHERFQLEVVGDRLFTRASPGLYSRRGTLARYFFGKAAPRGRRAATADLVARRWVGRESVKARGIGTQLRRRALKLLIQAWPRPEPIGVLSNDNGRSAVRKEGNDGAYVTIQTQTLLPVTETVRTRLEETISWNLTYVHHPVTAPRDFLRLPAQDSPV